MVKVHAKFTLGVLCITDFMVELIVELLAFKYKVAYSVAIREPNESLLLVLRNISKNTLDPSFSDPNPNSFC